MASSNAQNKNASSEFKNARIPDNAKDTPEDTQEKAPESEVPVTERPETDSTRAFDSDEKFIVHRQQTVDGNGNPTEKVHGPMPVSEWDDYARENNL